MLETIKNWWSNNKYFILGIIALSLLTGLVTAGLCIASVLAGATLFGGMSVVAAVVIAGAAGMAIAAGAGIVGVFLGKRLAFLDPHIRALFNNEEAVPVFDPYIDPQYYRSTNQPDYSDHEDFGDELSSSVDSDSDSSDREVNNLDPLDNLHPGSSLNI